MNDDRRQEYRRPSNFDRRNPRRGRDGGSPRGGDRGRSKQPDYRSLLTDLQQRTSIDPFERIRLETTPDIHTTRAMELVSPIGKGQRCLIVSPPKAGKTTMLQDVARAVEQNHPEILVMVLLVDERPEEVTGFRRAVKSEVFAASSDLSAQDHVALAERCLAKALEPVIAGRDVMILLDSITRLARAYNTVSEGVGRTMSGGLDAATMHAPRQIFGAARKIEEGGSLTILGTALVETGSRMDEVIFQEFKGTGNTEIVLSRALFEKRIFPAVDITQSGTRKQEKLYPPEIMKQLNTLQRALAGMEKSMAMRKLLDLLERYPTNAEALAAIGAALAPEKAV
ncbi:MAG TPA: transcription termination factor Rho [Candidatus Eisenbacteria bacterium]|nr:transcription termination factor Rho [Candidatus Eisenbacteria bacterium]